MKKILIVDDACDYAENLKFLLLNEGYDVMLAANGQEGVARAMDAKPDLILMDVMMPELDGVEAARAILEQADGGAAPIIFLTSVTASDNAAVVVAGQDYPAISKMADHRTILARIKNCVERS